MLVITLILTFVVAATECAENWQSDADNQLVGVGFIGAAIIGLDGGTKALSGDLELKKSESQDIVKLFQNPWNVFVTGVTVGGNKYMGVKGTGSSIFGKKGAGGVVLAKALTVILIGVYDETLQSGKAAVLVQKLANYLIDNGY